jgi:acetyl/propionyl-CoA carboxylase alpha subunit
MCTGLDLVELQLRLAAGEPMPPEVARAEATGAALQARIEASTDPRTGDPFTSRVEAARWPPAPQGKVRIEAGVKPGSHVFPEHDPTVCTVTTYAPNRHDALLMLDRILAEIHLSPLVTNLRLLRKALNHESLRAGQYDDGFLERI